MKPKTTGGGWAAIWYSLRMASRVGWLRLWNAMRSKNACKTCALGMGGQAGGMRNESGLWPEVCKKSFQAMVADMQAGITPEFFAKFSLTELQALSSRELEWCGRLQTPVYAGPGDTHYRVVDWEFAHVGGAAEDWSFLATTASSTNNPTEWRALIERETGTRLSADEWSYWEAFNLFKLACGNRTYLAQFESGADRSPAKMIAGTAVFHDVLRRLMNIVPVE